MAEFLLLDIVAWSLHKDGVTLDIAALPLHKNDIQDLRWFFFERYRGMACTRMTRTNQVVFFSCEELPGKLSVWPQSKKE